MRLYDNPVELRSLDAMRSTKARISEKQELDGRRGRGGEGKCPKTLRGKESGYMFGCLLFVVVVYY